MVRRNRLISFMLLLAVVALAGGVGAQASGFKPLGIGLEEIDYPYPVHYLDLTIEGQLLRMAYMDIAPAGAANGKTVVLFHGRSFAGDVGATAVPAPCDPTSTMRISVVGSSDCTVRLPASRAKRPGLWA
jgi:hypothetical protein